MSGDYKQTLINSGITPTSQRIAMAEVLLNKDMHVTAEEVFTLVNKKMNKSSRATIYNNLNLFEKAGLIKSLQVDNGMTVYDTNVKPHIHILDDHGKPADIVLNEEEESLLRSILEKSLDRQSMTGFSFNKMDIMLK